MNNRPETTSETARVAMLRGWDGGRLRQSLFFVLFFVVAVALFLSVLRGRNTLAIETRHLLSGNTHACIAAYSSLLENAPHNVIHANRLLQLTDHLADTSCKAKILFRVGAIARERRTQSAQVLHALATRTQAAGILSAADEALRYAIALHPENGEYRVALADILLERGDRTAALLHYAAVMRHTPECEHAAKQITRILDALEQPDIGRRWWRQLHETHPDAAVPAYHYGQVLERLGERKQALSTYTAALRSRPDFPELELRLGVVIAIEEAYTKGRALMNEALKKESRLHLPFSRGLAEITVHYIETGAHVFAEALLQEALDAIEDGDLCPFTFAEILTYHGRAERARPLLEALLRKHPMSPRAAALYDRVAHEEH